MFSFYLIKVVSDDVTLESVKFATQKFKDRTLLLFGLSVELSNTLVLWMISKLYPIHKLLLSQGHHDNVWWVRGLGTIWPTEILKSWKVIIIPTASYRATQLYVALVICVFLQVFCMGMFYNNLKFSIKSFSGTWNWWSFSCKNEKIFVKHGIQHIWSCHRQQCYQSLVLLQNKLPFRVRMISNLEKRNLKRFL